MLPPPVQNATLWPTPETAQDEEKKKATDKGDRADKEKAFVINAKPHGKEKWTPVPYTPSVIFETQLTTSSKRGGRPGRGGREMNGRGGSHLSNGSVGGDKVTTHPVGTSAAGDAVARGRMEAPTGKGPYGVPKQAKRASSAAGSTPKEQQRLAPSLDKSRELDSRTDAANASPPSTAGSRRTSIATQTDGTTRPRHDARQFARPDPTILNGSSGSNGQKSDRYATNDGESHAHHSSAPVDRRGDAPARASEYFRDNGHYASAKERGDGRPDRGRGGFRGNRGGNGGFLNVQQQHPPNVFQSNHQGNAGSTSPYGFAKAGTYGSPHQQQQAQSQSQSQPQPQQSTASSQYGPGPQRNQRGAPRSQTLPNNGMFARVHSQAGPTNMAPIQTQLSPMYEYPAAQAMTAVPYSPYAEQYSTLGMVSLQL